MDLLKFQKDETNNELIRNLLSVNGVEDFLGKDFISVNKDQNVSWDEVKHIIISLINDFYASGKEYVIDKNLNENLESLNDLEKNIIKILDQD